MLNVGGGPSPKEATPLRPHPNAQPFRRAGCHFDKSISPIVPASLRDATRREPPLRRQSPMTGATSITTPSLPLHSLATVKMRPSSSSSNQRSPLSPPRATATNNQQRTGPVSPKSPTSPTSGRDQWPALQLPNFPRFHPAVFQSKSSGGNGSHKSTSVVRSGWFPSGSTSPRGHGRSLSAIQRDLVASAARAAATLEQPAPRTSTPKAPALKPHGSPGPATPLHLEGGDYFSAGAAVQRESPTERLRREGGSASPAASPRG